MRHFALAFAVVLGGCAGSLPPQPAPVTPVWADGTVKGEGTTPRVLVGGFQMNEVFRVKGDFKYVVQPVRPFVTLSGDWSLVVEPRPGREAAAMRAIQTGEVVIKRAGTVGSLNRTGTIDAAAPSAEQPPPAPPPAGPSPTPISLIACPDDPCSGGRCCVPPLEVNPCVTSR